MFVSPAAILLLSACDPSLRPGGRCAEGVDAEACDDRFCGDPNVSMASVRTMDGGDLDWTPLTDGAPWTVVRGTQPGFHVSGGVETENLCSVVFLDFLLEIASPGGGRETALEERKHVQTLRCQRLADDGVDGFTDATCTRAPTRQRWWDGGRMLDLPCVYWPGGDWDISCDEEPVLAIDEWPAFLTVTATDHDGRSATSTVEVEPRCCEQ